MNKEQAEEYTQSLEQSLSGGWRLTLLAKQMGVPQALGITTEEWVKRIGGYVRQSLEERKEAVRELTQEGLSTREIGEVLGIDHATVARDRTVANATDKETMPEGSEEKHVANA